MRRYGVWHFSFAVADLDAAVAFSWDVPLPVGLATPEPAVPDMPSCPLRDEAARLAEASSGCGHAAADDTEEAHS